MDRYKLNKLLPLLVGVVLLAVCFYSIYWRLAFLNRCVETRATVIDVRWETHHDKDGWHTVGYPVYRFTTTSGRELEASGYGTSSPPSVGDERIILYDPKHPTSIVVNSWLNIWAISLFTALMGSVFTAAGILQIGGRLRPSSEEKTITIDHIK